MVGLFLSQAAAVYTYTDASDDMLALVKANVDLNDASPHPPATETPSSSAPPIAQDSVEPPSLPTREEEGGARPACEWRCAPLTWGGEGPELDALGRGGYDIVVACDVIYDRTVVPSLMATAAALLRPPTADDEAGGDGGPVFVLSYMSRCYMPEREMLSLLYSEAERQGLKGTHVEAKDLPLCAHRPGAAAALREQLMDGEGKVFHFRRKAAGGRANVGEVRL
jgi:hypothetical protein